MDTKQHVTGIANDGANRDRNDFYVTPSWATEALMEKEEFTEPIWEPACGDGAISKVLATDYKHVFSSDLYDYGFGTPNIDFLKVEMEYPTIITNPPYKFAVPFVEKALELTYIYDGTVAMLMRLQFLEGSKRKKLFEETPLRTVYVFSKRLSMSRGGTELAQNGMMAFAWYVWDWSYQGPPTLEWI